MAGNVETTNADVLPDGKAKDAPSGITYMNYISLSLLFILCLNAAI